MRTSRTCRWGVRTLLPFMALAASQAGCTTCANWASRDGFCFGDSTAVDEAEEVCESFLNDSESEAERVRMECMLRCWNEAPSCQDFILFEEGGSPWWDHCNTRCSARAGAAAATFQVQWDLRVEVLGPRASRRGVDLASDHADE